jgi:hypothetical protein
MSDEGVKSNSRDAHVIMVSSEREDAPMPTNQKEVAEFIHTMISELAAMARNAKLDSLSYILEVAKHEASQALPAGVESTPPARAAAPRPGERKQKRTRVRAA